jgi:hypothetical protein
MDSSQANLIGIPGVSCDYAPFCRPLSAGCTGCPASSVISFPLSGIMSDNFTHCVGWWQWISHHPSEIAKIWWKMTYTRFLVVKMPLKSVRQGQMIDLYSVVTFFHKARWTGLAITHEIKRVPGENTISYSTVWKCVRMFVLSMKETDTLIVPNRRVISVLTTASPLCSQRRHFFQSTKLSRRWRSRNQ